MLKSVGDKLEERCAFRDRCSISRLRVLSTYLVGLGWLLPCLVVSTTAELEVAASIGLGCALGDFGVIAYTRQCRYLEN